MFTKSIIIVDDDPDLINVYSEALKMSGYDVSSFTDPCLAINTSRKTRINTH
jgi:DNA-binding response OmpR family regulator